MSRKPKIPFTITLRLVEATRSAALLTNYKSHTTAGSIKTANSFASPAGRVGAADLDPAGIRLAGGRAPSCALLDDGVGGGRGSDVVGGLPV